MKKIQVISVLTTYRVDSEEPHPNITLEACSVEILDTQFWTDKP